MKYASVTSIGGIVRCAAVKQSFTLTNTGTVLSSVFSSSFFEGDTNSSVVISDLSALTTFKVYCAATTVSGASNGLNDILSTEILVSTLCCRRATFTNSPSTVFGTVDENDQSRISSYVFTYKLSSLPTGIVRISPILSVASGTNSVGSIGNVSVIQPTLEFSNNSAITTGSFFLSDKSQFTGSVVISLSYSGSSAFEYFDASTTVFIRSTAMISKPPPSLSTVQFDSTGGSVVFIFSSNTDRAGISISSFGCSLLFSFVGANVTTCSWIDDRRIVGIFPSILSSEKLLVVNSNATLLSQKIKARCEPGFNCSLNSFAQKQSVLAIAPESPQTPVPILSIPAVLSSCENLTIDASQSFGSASRLWSKVEWTISSPTANTMGILSTLNAAGVDLLKPITISRKHVGLGLYTIGLELTNYLGTSGSLVQQFGIVINSNTPKISIAGPKNIVIKRRNALELFVDASLSSCSTVRALTLTNDLLLDGSIVENVRSQSVNPRRFILAANSLNIGETYTFAATATTLATDMEPAASSTATATVSVISGDVFPLINGGVNRRVSTNQSFILDASASFDEDGLLLSYHWNCLHLSTSRFGSSCDMLLGGLNLAASIVTIPSFRLPADLYSFTVTVSATDGRSASVEVIVQISSSVLAQVLVQTDLRVFDVSKQLTVFGQATATSSLTLSWSAFVANRQVFFGSSTPLSRIVTAANVVSGFFFPLVVASRAFTAGSIVTFRLSAILNVGGVSSTAAFSEISLIASQPPTGGILLANPETGQALATLFTLRSTGWSSNDLPLTFDFSYQQTSASPVLFIQKRNALNSATSVFPPGTSGSQFKIRITSLVYDTNLLTASSTAQITVHSSEGRSGVRNFLTSNLVQAKNTGNSDQIFQTVNAASTTLNQVNCSLVSDSFCASINRNPCVETSQTCSACFEGLAGVEGDSNIRCFKESSSLNTAGDSCRVNTDCAIGTCIDGICEDPLKLCPGLLSDGFIDCSGHGQCIYSDLSGNTLDTFCSVSDIFCNVACVCDTGFAGFDCSITPEEFEDVDDQRRLMCDSLVEVASIINPSAELIDTLVGSLQSTFRGVQRSSVNTTTACQVALESITSLVESGLLNDVRTSTLKNLVMTSSKFVTSLDESTLASGNTSVSRRLDNSNEFIQNIMQTISGGVLGTMANGENPISITSDNIKITLFKDFIDPSINSSFGPPQSSTQLLRGSSSAILEIVGSSYGACDQGEGYAHLSLLQWGIIPLPNSRKIESPIVRYGASLSPTSTRKLSSIDLPFSGLPAYFLTFPFQQPQDFNLSLTPKAIFERQNNFTFPDCQVFTGSEYVTCDNCNVSSYNNFYVTFSCFDIDFLCPSTSTSRRLASATTTDFSAEALNAWNLNDQAFFEKARSKRVLQDVGIDIRVDDDESISNEDVTRQFGVILLSIKEELSTILRLNPFNLDVEKAVGVLVFVGCIFSTVFAGIAYFHVWDKEDKNFHLYASKEFEKKRKAMKKRSKEDEKKKGTIANKGGLFKSVSLSLAFRRRRYALVKKMAGFDLNDTNKASVDSSGSDGAILVENRNVGVLNNPLVVNSSIPQKKKPVIRNIVDEVTDFLITVMPTDSLLVRRRPLVSFFKAVGEEHDYAAMFGSPSISRTRTIRWLKAVMSFLSQLFIDTLFFGLFFPNDGSCESRDTREDCLRDENTATGQTFCKFTKNFRFENGGYCELNEPPETVLFISVIAFFIIVFSIPLDFFYSYILYNYCARRPVLEKIGLDSTLWMGSSQDTYTKNIRQESSLKELFNEVESRRLKAGGSAAISRKKLINLRSRSKLEDESDTDFIARNVYHDFTTANEEVDVILHSVKSFLDDYVEAISESTAWILEDHDSNLAQKHAKVKAISKYLRILPDGNPAPLTLLEKLR